MNDELSDEKRVELILNALQHCNEPMTLETVGVQFWRERHQKPNAAMVRAAIARRK